MCFILEIKTNIEKLSKGRTPPISRQFFLHQRCPLIGENTVVPQYIRKPINKNNRYTKKNSYTFTLWNWYRAHFITN